MRDELLKIIQMLKIGGILDGIISQSLTDDGISKDDIIRLVRENVQIKEMIIAIFGIGVNALKQKAANDGKTDYLDLVAQIADLADDMIASAIAEYLEDLLKEDEPAKLTE